MAKLQFTQSLGVGLGRFARRLGEAAVERELDGGYGRAQVVGHAGELHELAGLEGVAIHHVGFLPLSFQNAGGWAMLGTACERGEEGQG